MISFHFKGTKIALFCLKLTEDVLNAEIIIRHEEQTGADKIQSCLQITSMLPDD